MILNLNTGAEQICYTDYEMISDILIEGDKIYLSTYRGIMDITGAIVCLTDHGEKVWERKMPDAQGVVDRLKVVGNEDAQYLSYRMYSKLGVLNKADGSFAGETEMASEIVGYGAVADSDLLLAMTREGTYHFYNITSQNDMILEGKFVTNSNNIKEFKFGKGYFASFSYRDTAMTIYEYAAGEQLTQIKETGTSILKFRTNREETLCAYETSKAGERKIDVIRYPESDPVTSIETSDYVSDFYFTDEETICMLIGDSIYQYDAKSGEIKREISILKEASEYISATDGYFTEEGKKAIVTNSDTIFLVDTADGKILNRIVREDEQGDGVLLYGVNQSASAYAYLSRTENGIRVGDFMTKQQTLIPAKVNCITYLSLNNTGDTLYATYLDAKVEEYDTKTGQLLKTYTEFGDEVEQVIEQEKSGKTILVGSTNAYILNDAMEVVGCIRNYHGILPEHEKFLLSNSSGIYETPIYNLEMLLEEAGKE